jgi:hypothetical protein
MWAETEFNLKKLAWILKDKEANQREIEKIRQDEASDPIEPVDCSRWEK